MINFHKYGFLDCKRLISQIKDKGYWLKDFNPIWLFVWSDLYKPLIAFTNDFIYIRIYDRQEGILYYPPIGSGDMKLALYEMKNDAKEVGADLKICAIDSLHKETLLGYRINSSLNLKKTNYIFSANNLLFDNKKKYKYEMKLIKEFYKEYPNTYSRIIKKDDFPKLLEFINNWNSNGGIDLANVSFFQRLDMIKKSMEHLYELDLVGLLLLDEEKIYGFSLASIISNTAYIHAFMTLSDIEGSAEALMAAFSRLLLTRVRYINFDCDNGIKEVREGFLKLKPLKLEEYNQTFLDEDEN